MEAAFVVLTRRAIEREKGQPIVIDLRDTCLAGVRAQKADLTGISLVGSALHGADLAEVHGDLVGLHKLNLTGANLYRADLAGSDLTGARLNSSKISPNVLTDVKLVNVDLGGVDLSGVKLTGVDLTGAKHDSSAWW